MSWTGNLRSFVGWYSCTAGCCLIRLATRSPRQLGVAWTRAVEWKCRWKWKFIEKVTSSLNFTRNRRHIAHQSALSHRGRVKEENKRKKHVSSSELSRKHFWLPTRCWEWSEEQAQEREERERMNSKEQKNHHRRLRIYMRSNERRTPKMKRQKNRDDDRPSWDETRNALKEEK